jgi:cytosine/adenosine deaminase-related metal-dependent hydrolase
MKWKVENATVVNYDDVLESITFYIDGERFKSISPSREYKYDVLLSLKSDVFVYPGFINAHDHLLGTYWPKVGRKDGKPYENWLYWDNDLKSSDIYFERQQIDAKYLYLLGAYKNLISATTTVSDHIPHFVNEPYIPILPVRVLKNYCLAHAVSSFALKWGDSIPIEYKRAVENNWPFITHIEEGFDEETKECLPKLDGLGALGRNTVLIHGIAFSKEDIDLIAKRGASVVWCPDSNMFMFKTTTNVPYLIEKGVNLCLGTDSTMSGGLNILYELKRAKEVYRELFGDEIDDQLLFKMITINPAKAFLIENELGEVKEGKLADFVVVRKNYPNPYKNIVEAELEDVLLVVIAGKPLYGLKSFSALFDRLGIKYEEIKLKKEKRIIKKGLIETLTAIRNAIGKKKNFPFMPVSF